jgi:hypothetical protein
MRAWLLGSAGCALAISLSGCTTNNYIGAAPRVVLNTGPSCWLPTDRDQHYLESRSTIPIHPIAPSLAATNHLSGCAAVIFHLTPDGKARDIQLLREYPVGYGYGNAISDAVLKATFNPVASPISPDGWYYHALSIGLPPVPMAAPAPSANPPPAPPPLPRA